MKATGIIRRIDDLGRIVIPQDIRRTMRIRSGDPLEIFLDEQGGVIFRKYSPLEINDDVLRTANLIAKFSGMEIAIYDIDCRLTDDESYPEIVPEAWEDFRTPTQFENYTVYPILCNGECYGYVCSHSHRIAEVVMIVRYLAAAICSD
jgi:AbrB family looped-hinge helix DNA binding protein